MQYIQKSGVYRQIETDDSITRHIRMRALADSPAMAQRDIETKRFLSGEIRRVFAVGRHWTFSAKSAHMS
jgi:hypothetical protein